MPATKFRDRIGVDGTDTPAIATFRPVTSGRAIMVNGSYELA